MSCTSSMCVTTTPESELSLQRRCTNLGVKVYPSQTNFVLANFESQCALSRGDLRGSFESRNSGSKTGFTAFADCIRFTIGLEEEMREVANTLRQLLS